MPRFFTRPRAAEYLTELGVDITAQALADKATDGKGPEYTIVNNRAVYTREALDRWVALQAARPLVRRARRQKAGEGAAA